jgi:hypothetical protein
MSLRYAALLAPACAFTHSQQPNRIVVRRDYSSIDDVFDSMFDDAFDAWSPFGLSRRRDPWSPFGMTRRRSPLAQQFGQLKRLSQAFEEQLQRVDEDDFLADTPLGQRRQLGSPKEDAPTKTDESTSSLYEAPKAEDDAPGAEAVAPAAPRGYAYSWSSSSVTQNGETRTTVRKNFKDADGAAKSFQERSLARDGKKLTETRTQGFGDAEAKLSFEGVDDASAFESAWATKPALEAPAAEAPAAEAPEPNKEELAADAEIAKLKAELKALRGDPLPPADYGTTQV